MTPNLQRKPSDGVAEGRLFCSFDPGEEYAADAVQHLPKAGKAAGVIHHGDAAFLRGEKGDYGTLGSLLDPIRAAGLPIHILLGNHDERMHFYESFGLRIPMGEQYGNHHVAVVEGKQANFYLLDSLESTNGTPGVLGEGQLRWLAKTLDMFAAAVDSRTVKPAIVCLHHNPEFAQVKKISGLKDTEALMEVLRPRKQVKALVYGHTHHWAHTEKDSIHCVNLPPTAYVFQERDPNGWVELSLTESVGRFTLHALEAGHKANGQTFDCKWRA